jgi:hypothetical protein
MVVGALSFVGLVTAVMAYDWAVGTEEAQKEGPRDAGDGEQQEEDDDMPSIDPTDYEEQMSAEMENDLMDDLIAQVQGGGDDGAADYEYDYTYNTTSKVAKIEEEPDPEADADREAEGTPVADEQGEAVAPPSKPSPTLVMMKQLREAEATLQTEGGDHKQAEESLRALLAVSWTLSVGARLPLPISARICTLACSHSRSRSLISRPRLVSPRSSVCCAVRRPT